MPYPDFQKALDIGKGGGVGLGSYNGLKLILGEPLLTLLQDILLVGTVVEHCIAICI